ncbi:MAG: nucleoside deaminase [Prolixibacteraceae bacterium]|nr:nucleoside deaminase [Prolixibacteraceae bacterium]MDD4756747.1 nucleoside deaminase [Prolixibacteraceae bacterium]NLO02700.1 nucleoside deaminase [Bacteroidales bacterium]
MITPFNDEYYMRAAFAEALKAFDAGEVPVGGVVVAGGKIIVRVHNLTETLNDVTAHAEMQAITAAANLLGGKYLNDCTLYITLEPCVMCAAALSLAQIGKVVFGTADEKRGYSLVSKNIMHPKTKISGGIMKDECAELMRDFFRRKR